MSAGTGGNAPTAWHFTAFTHRSIWVFRLSHVGYSRSTDHSRPVHSRMYGLSTSLESLGRTIHTIDRWTSIHETLELRSRVTKAICF